MAAEHHRPCPDGGELRSFSPSAVTRVVSSLLAKTKEKAQRNWLAAVATRVERARPDLAPALDAVLGPRRLSQDILDGRSIGEISVCYEALLSQLDSSDRRDSGQYFTPDDAALFMAKQAAQFPPGSWTDPCCGVGNLAWYLTLVQPDRGHFLRDGLRLCDVDDTALRTAVALLSCQYAPHGDVETMLSLFANSECRDFLGSDFALRTDYAIANPPYARVPPREEFETATTRESFAYFMEKIAKGTRGFVVVTPSAYLSVPKYRHLRTVLDKNAPGGSIFVFDNVPDTLFRGYKFGSTNSSTTNFVRAAITVSPPEAKCWEVTPILRWKSKHRSQMLSQAPSLLTPRRIGPGGQWVKISPHLARLWDRLNQSPRTIRDLTTKHDTPWALTVASTPRYFISAAFRDLQRASKVRLFFPSRENQELAAAVLNSSLPYLWWRSLDGGLTLSVRILLSVPVPRLSAPADLVARLRAEEELHLTRKLNSGRINENVKRPADLVRDLDRAMLPDCAPDLEMLYADSMFGPKRAVKVKHEAQHQ